MQILPNAPLFRSSCSIRRDPDLRPASLACGRRRRGLLAVVATVFASFLWANCVFAEDPPVASDDPDDFLDMDLDELVETEREVQVQMEATQEQIGVQEGILGGHVHRAGELMVGYKYMYMQMDGNRIGSRRISDTDVFAEGFMVAPTDMTMHMHMTHFMYAPSDQWTFMAMVPFKRLSMNHLRQNSSTFNVTTEGIGDVSLSAFYTFFDREQKIFADPHPDQKKNCWWRSWYEHHQAFAGLALYFPTGTIDATTPMGARAPYPMQLGSGTYDLEPSLTYSGISENWGWGLHASALLRLGTNANAYSASDRYVVSGWLARKITDRWSCNVRLEQVYLSNYRGADPALNPMMAPTARPDLRGGTRLDFWVGLTRYIPEGALEGNRFSVEYGVPLSQVLDGPQLEVDGQLIGSWSWTF